MRPSKHREPSVRRGRVCVATIAAVALGAAGCAGGISGGGEPSGGEGAAGQPSGGGSPGGGLDRPAATAGDKACTKAVDPGPTIVRRLNRFEYNRTVKDLLGDTTKPADSFPPEAVISGFDNDADSLTVSGDLVEAQFKAARELAARATQDLTKLLACDVAKMGEAACGRTFIATFSARAYRRPPESDELTRLGAIFDLGLKEEGLRGGLERVIRTVLQAPQFLYKIEPGAAGTATGAVPVGPWELATRLSYLFWGTMPDEALFAAARDGRLTGAKDVLAQAQRMIKDPRAREVVLRFHHFWLHLDEVEHLDKDTKVFPTFKLDLLPLFRQETETFVSHVIWDGDGTLGTLMSAPFTFVNERLATFYGLTGITGTSFKRVDLNPAQRAGFLTHASIMANQAKPTMTEPIFRGMYVRTDLLCDAPPAPPQMVVENFKLLPAGLTGRARLEQHRQDASCAGCHALIDGIGLGLENIDGVGRWRDTDAGKPVDARGEVVGTDVEGPFVGPVALAKKLAASAQVRECVLQKWFQFSFGRAATEADACSIAQARKVFDESGHRVRDLLIAFTQTDAFLFRRASP